jgi:hypothetical protein
MDMAISALFPILLVVPLFGRILKYINTSNNGTTSRIGKSALIAISICLPLVKLLNVYFQIGRTIVEGLASAIAWVIQSAHTGTGFAFSSFTSGKQMDIYPSVYH